MNFPFLSIDKYCVICSGVLFLTACGGGDSNLTNSTPSAVAPTINLSLNTPTLFSGQQGKLSWSSNNASNCVASDAWSGAQATSGSLNITAVGTGINTYTLSCTGPTGTSKQSINLTVNPPPLSFIAGQIGGIGNFDGVGVSARINNASGMAIDSTGNTYIADTRNHTIRKVNPDGVVTTYAGTAGKPGYADGPSASAQFSFPSSVTIDRSGNVYVSDGQNNVIRKISPAGIVTTFAGLAGQSGETDGVGQAARFSSLQSITIDSQDNLYVIDSFGQTVRKISSSSAVTTLDPIGKILSSTVRPCTQPIRDCVMRGNATGIYADANDTIYVTDISNSQIIWLNKSNSAGIVSTSGAAIEAPLNIAGDTSGNIYVSDRSQRKIYKLRVSISTDKLVANAEIWKDFSNATLSEFPYAIASFQDKYLILGNGSTLQKAMPAGSMTTFIGSSASLGSQDGVGKLAEFNGANTVVSDNNGDLYVSDTDNHTIRKINIATGVVSTIAGQAGNAGTNDGMGPLARLNSPTALAVDGSANVFFTDTQNQTIRKISPNGLVTTFVGKPGEPGKIDGNKDQARLNYPQSLAFDKDGNLYVVELEGIRKISPNGDVRTLPLAAADTLQNANPSVTIGHSDSLAIDSKGNIFASSKANNNIYKIAPNGLVSLFAGSTASNLNGGYQDGKGVDARFSSIGGLAIDRNDNLLVSDSGNNTLRKITPDGMVSTIAGTFGKSTINPFSLGYLANPRGITIDKAGKMFIILDQAVFQMNL